MNDPIPHARPNDHAADAASKAITANPAMAERGRSTAGCARHENESLESIGLNDRKLLSGWPPRQRKTPAHEQNSMGKNF